MKYGSVCSGIEAATKAWHPLGWEPSFFSEIEAFPSAVLNHHYPSVPNLGDMTKFEEWPDHAIDLLVGGTPCQSFSVAGLRQGLADPRGNLMLTYLAIARRYQPRWLVWENVPGVLSSNGGRDFGTLIRGLEECGYHAAWRVLDAQFVRVDGFERAVPQRRRRVFVVGYLGDWRRAAAVLLEPEGMRGDSAPRRQAGQRTAGTIEASAARSRGAGISPGVIVDEAARCVTAGYAQRLDWETENFVAHSLRAEGFDASEDGTGRGTPIVPVPFDTTQVTSKANRSHPKAGDPCHPLAAGAHAPAIAYGLRPDASRSGEAKTPSRDANGNLRLRDAGFNVYEGFSPTLDATAAPTVAHAIQAGALRENPDSGPDGVGVQADLAYTLEARAEVQAIQQQWAVRRLTPRECERLQGFPDDFTNIPYRNRLAADGPRYKSLGNSMAVNVMRWIGQRIQAVENISMEAAE